MSSVRVTNVSPATTESKLCEFFAICGLVRSVRMDLPAASAIVTFEAADAAETAVMFTGAAIVDSAVTITLEGKGGEQMEEEKETTSSSSRSAMEIANAAIAAGYLKGEALVTAVRAKAHSIDTGRVTRMLKRGDRVKGSVVTGQWSYRTLQPQWGVKPGW